MSKHRSDLTHGSPFPSTFVNAQMEFISTLVSNLVLEVIASNAATASVADTVRIAAGAGDDQVCIGISGRWRFNSATVTAAHPGGALGTYDVWVTADDNDFTLADPADATDYSFGLAIRAAGDPPTTPLSRQIGVVFWDGAKITDYLQTAGGVPPLVPVGVQVPYAGVGDPVDSRFLLADGRLVSRGVYPLFYSKVGHAYNAGVDPLSNQVRLPDKRGRMSVGADNMGTPQGTGFRLNAVGGSHPNQRGQNGGFERHTLSALESGVNGNGGMSPAGAHSHRFWSWGTPQGGGPSTAPMYQALQSAAWFDGWIEAVGNHGHSLTARTADNSHENMPPYEVDNWIVRVR